MKVGSTTPKVIHIVEILQTGSVENWLLRMFRHARKQGLHLDWTFYCILPEEGALDEVARELGAGVVHSPVALTQKWAFITALRRELRRERYDVMHCHHDLLSAVYLAASAGLSIRRRLVHVHNADDHIPARPSRQRVLKEAFRRSCLTMADNIVGVSNHSVDTFLAGRDRCSRRDLVHYSGVEAAALALGADHREMFRRESGVDRDALILLFAGRLVPEKNPLFVLDVLEEIRKREPRVVAMFAGTGYLRSTLELAVQQRRLSSVVKLLGWRADVVHVMHCADWFILPHPELPKEGFGLAIVEAQLAGLRLLLSTGITDDPLLCSAVFRRLPLSAGAGAWAEAALDLFRDSEPSRAAALTALRESPMDMDRALQHLLTLHE